MPLSPVLIVHVCAGTLGLASGTTAMVVRKGSRSHGWAGLVFAIAMLSLAASGTYLAYMKAQMGNILGGVLTFYMVATAWKTVRRRNKQTSMFDWMALLVALAFGTTCIAYGFEVAKGQADSKGVPAGMDFFFGFVILLAAAGDIRMLVRGGISGRQRTARHLWRMCFALFIASGSFFMGRQQIFPAGLQTSGLLIFLTILPLLLLVFWLIRIRFTNAYDRKLIPHSRTIHSVLT